MGRLALAVRRAVFARARGDLVIFLFVSIYHKSAHLFKKLECFQQSNTPTHKDVEREAELEKS